MPGEFLYGVNQWVLLVLTTAAFYLCAEAGYRYGRRMAAQSGPDVHSHVTTIESALLGLLALLLGFAFAMAMNRFDVRKNVVVEEANDLRTTYLRAQLLPATPRDADMHRLHDAILANQDRDRQRSNAKGRRSLLVWV